MSISHHVPVPQTGSMDDTRRGSRSSSADDNSAGIDKLSFDENRIPRSSTSDHGSEPRRGSYGLLRDDVSLLSIVVEGVIERDRQRLRRRIIRYTSFASAVISWFVCFFVYPLDNKAILTSMHAKDFFFFGKCSLCAGSVAAFSLYGPLLISRLHYSQFQVNAISVATEIAEYLLVPFVGYVCDRYSRRLVSLAAAIFFGGGYLLAACTYRQGPHDEGGWSYGVMMVAFIGVGLGTCLMMMASVTTCAKSFARSRHKGVALAVPLAAFGLSGVWLAQVGTRLLYEPGPYGGRGDVDVYRFFLFLAGLLFSVGIVGAMTLQSGLEEEEPIDEAAVAATADGLDRRGLLEDTSMPSPGQTPVREESGSTTAYGAISIGHSSQSSVHDSSSPSPTKIHFPGSDRLKKTITLNEATRRFLKDGNMWLLASGFFLILGPAEAFIFNLGTIVHSLYPAWTQSSPPFNSPATNVSVVAISSTVTRLLTGILSDYFAPQPPSTTLDVKPSGRGAWQRPAPSPPSPPRRLQLSRVALLIICGFLLSVGQLLLASSVVQRYPSLFPLVSALNGIGYGAVFSLTPIIISVVWGVDNFGTNWGIVAITPAMGGSIWGAVYSIVYEHGVGDRGAGGNGRGRLDAGGVIGRLYAGGGKGGEEDLTRLCYGATCYTPTFAAMTICSWIALAAWTRAWRAWRRDGIIV